MRTLGQIDQDQCPTIRTFPPPSLTPSYGFLHARTQAPMKPSPIADYNNLSLIGQHMVYAHTRAVSEEGCTLREPSAQTQTQTE